jgi:hypothetical protein
MFSCHYYHASGGSQFVLKYLLSENQEWLAFSRAVVNTVMNLELSKNAGNVTD